MTWQVWMAAGPIVDGICHLCGQPTEPDGTVCWGCEAEAMSHATDEPEPFLPEDGE